MNSKFLLLPGVIACALFLSACNKDGKNHAPTGGSQMLSTMADTPLNGELIGADVDGDKLSYSVTTQPTQGMLTVAADGSFVYTPNEDTVGSDAFSYVVSDGKLSAAPATMSITINPLDVAFGAYSRKAFAQAESADALSLNTRNVTQDVTEETAYDDLLEAQ